MKNHICILISAILFFFTGFSQKNTNQEFKEILSIGENSVSKLLKIADSLASSKDIFIAEEYYQMSFDLARKKNVKEDIVTTGFKLSQFLSATLDKHQQAEKVIDFLLGYCTEQQDEDCKILTIIRYGELSKKKLHFIDALKYFNKAIQQVEKRENPDLYWQALTSRGLFLINIGDFTQSRKDFKKAIGYVTEKASIYNRRSSTYINISTSFADKKFDSMVYYSRLAVRDCHDDKTSRHCNLAYNNLAWAIFLKGMPEEALNIINTNIDLTNIEYSFEDSLYPALMHTLGAIYYKNGNYIKALKHFQVSHRYFQKRNDITNLIIVKEDLSKVYEKIGNLKASLDILREIKPFISKLDSLKITREIARIENEKILKNKAKQIYDLEQKNFKIGEIINKNRLLSYFLGLCLFVAISTFLYRQHKNKIRFYQLNEQLSLNRLKSLRFMMNPHFLFNSFSTLQNYILKKDNLKANEYMIELSDLIRNVISSSDSIYISFKEELQIIESYIRLEQERFNNNFEVVYDINNELLHSNFTIPSMLIQPYIENAIIHGFSHSNKKCLLILSIHKKCNTIICKILDNGIGRDEAERIQNESNNTIHLSIATKNTDERLRILSKVGYNKASVEINDLFDDSGKSKGTEVIITISILNKNK